MQKDAVNLPTSGDCVSTVLFDEEDKEELVGEARVDSDVIAFASVNDVNPQQLIYTILLSR